MTAAARGLRVLHVQKAAGISGSERHLLMLLPALADSGVRVRMVAATVPGGEVWVDELRTAGVDVRTVPAGRDLSPTLVRALVREVRAFRPDLVHTHLVHADVHGQVAARLAGVPGVSSVHGTTPAALRRLPLRPAAAAVGRLPALTIAISEYVASYLRDAGLRPAGRVRVVPYGIDAGEWAISHDDRLALRERMGVAPGEVIVAATSRLIPGKGHDLLIDAFAAAAGSHPELRLWIAGDGPERATLERRATGVPGVRFLGWVDDVRPVVQAADVVAFPTAPELGEGFGLTALEAMAAGRPVVATRVGAIPEVVVDGETGVVVEPHDTAALGEAIGRLAGEPGGRASLGADGARRAREHYGLDALVQATLTVYRDVAGRQPQPKRLSPRSTSDGRRSARSTSTPASRGNDVCRSEPATLGRGSGTMPASHT